MTPKIKRAREEALLNEIINESLSSFNNELLQSLIVTEVIISKGKSDAKVYMDKGSYNREDQVKVIKELNKKARFKVQNDCFEHTGWFKVPNLNFIFDNREDNINRVEELLIQAQKELKVNG